jgi:hypothetical protein
VARPTIAFAPPVDAGPMRTAAQAADAYDWIAVTSPQGAQAPSTAWLHARRRGRVQPARLAAVGEGTARALRELGLQPALVGGATPPRSGSWRARRGPAGCWWLAGDRARRPARSPDGGGAARGSGRLLPTVAAGDLEETAATARGASCRRVRSPSTFHRLRDEGRDGRLRRRAQALRRVTIGPVCRPPARGCRLPRWRGPDQGLVDALLRALST